MRLRKHPFRFFAFAPSFGLHFIIVVVECSRMNISGVLRSGGLVKAMAKYNGKTAINGRLWAFRGGLVTEKIWH